MESDLSRQPVPNQRPILRESDNGQLNQPPGKTKENKSFMNCVTAITHNLTMDARHTIRGFYVKEKYAFYLIILAILFIIIGCIPLMIPISNGSKTEHKLEYTNCERINFFNNSGPKDTCREYVERTNNTDCQCIEIFNITSALQGKVTLYFDLPSLDQTPDMNSRDNDQLKGILSKTPSESCEPYRYENGIPIVPCGALADSMFTDSVTNFYLLKNNSQGQSINILPYGMLSAEDRKGFYNPEDLENALEGFSKPKSWIKPLYQLDKIHPENNGLQNEHFISWMRTDWKRKQVAHIGDIKFIDGLPAGSYQITIYYRYPPFKYNGQRNLVFVAEKRNLQYYTSVLQQYVASVVLLCIEILILAAVAIYLKKYSEKRKHEKYTIVSQSQLRPEEER